ncbi:NAD(P)-dependent glycerol-3-phosphate dehydrogenase [Halovulum dunhuangense]|uniref:Glycerol-3-phosphate dehydrogenase [NAD(P)+] n=1 Tax=Halovulum dunhuangense TaxID=1505036 RepID=A0A849KQB8_9RHOB|nr:NAD(P)H-dependent glycerol-3-phosphate dehydrogenase [Halovulum dunhuangense]NNU79263.1 NAD(P)-dependent glycerol-3-phosphate dehydrogenase [Halovulum dunhuangense]
MRPVAVLGAGAFGTALAIVWARAGLDVRLVARPETAPLLQAARENQRALPAIRFPYTLQTLSSPENLPSDSILVLAVPAQATGAYLAQHAATLPPGAPLVLAAKGIDLDSGALLTDVAARHWPDSEIAVLSGPGFAAELAAGLPTALTLAARDTGLAGTLQTALSTPELRLYRSTDRIGVQLGGALKNVIAIACGICIGAGLGDSARAALMTRGYAEMLRLGLALGGDARSFQGLSGLGDLALTATSGKSRNFAAGLAIGAGHQPERGRTIEGLATARAVVSMARKLGLELPVAEATVAVLDGRLGIDAAMEGLLTRPLKEET